MADGFCWAVPVEVEAVAPFCVSHSSFYRQTQQCAADPGWGSEVECCTFVPYGAEARKGRLGDYRAEAVFLRKTLQHEGGAHRFAEAVDAFRFLARIEPIDPAMDVVGFEQSVGCQRASALAVRSRIG